MPMFDLENHAFVGDAGELPVPENDELTHRLAMLVEGECELGPKAAAEKFALSRQRYFQLRQQFHSPVKVVTKPVAKAVKHLLTDDWSLSWGLSAQLGPNPKERQALQLLAYVREQMNDWQGAIEVYRELVAEASEETKYWMSLANALSDNQPCNGSPHSSL